MSSIHEYTVPRAKDWKSLGEYLHSGQTMLLVPSRRQSLAGEWDTLQHLEEELDDAILIGLVGGTGVGKSTFINALAGSSISRSSDRRPTTSRVVVYRHLDTELPSGVPTQHLAQPQVLHQHGELSKVILFDFPDFDSAETSHREIVAEYLPHLDVAFVVVDDIKYGDRRLYDLLQTLEYDPSNFFVLLNKIDRLNARYGQRTEGVVQELLADLRGKLRQFAGLQITESQCFAIAAQPVFESRANQLSSEFDAGFQQIEKVLQRYQADKHRRAAKEKNLDFRKARLVEDLRQQALQESNRAIIDESQRLVDQWQGLSAQAQDAIPAEILSERERRALKSKHLRRVRGDWGQPVAALLTVIGELRWWQVEGVTADSLDFAARIQQHYRSYFESLANLRARVESEIAGTALAQQLTSASPLSTAYLETPAVLARRLADPLMQTVAHTARYPRRLVRWAVHLPALGVLLMAIWSGIHPVIDAAVGTGQSSVFSALARALIGTLSPTFLIGVGLAILVSYLVSAAIVWGRELQFLETEIARAERTIRDEIGQYGSRVIHAVDGRVRALHDEFEKLDKLTR